ncbi:Uncharacterized protein HZ326_3967 [Fusarium oxysporum f. sp. albedinis]|nr:Uncharacterized protein HZ326_3967 [Fusarium oxysporum f. sp. albedinis]
MPVGATFFRWLHIMIPNGHTAVMSLNDIKITDDNQTNKSMRVLPFVLRNSCFCVTNKVTQLSNHESPRILPDRMVSLRDNALTGINY